MSDVNVEINKNNVKYVIIITTINLSTLTCTCEPNVKVTVPEVKTWWESWILWNQRMDWEDQIYPKLIDDADDDGDDDYDNDEVSLYSLHVVH